jgi:hypothetical protein
MKTRTASFLLGTLLLVACQEPSAGPALLPSHATRFQLINGSDAAAIMGFCVALTDPVTDTTIRDGALWVQPIAPADDRQHSGPRCHLGCLVNLRVDLFLQRRSYRLGHRLDTPADTLVRFEWPRDTMLATEVPYAGDGVYCATDPGSLAR